MRGKNDRGVRKPLFKGPNVKELKFYKYIHTYILRKADVERV